MIRRKGECLISCEIDNRHIRRAIELARRGEGLVEPNPMVGCVIAIGDRVIAEGYHHEYGHSHAEVDAIQNLPNDADLSAATIYVTLEPCCHTGKTPPCTEAILRAGIGRVVIAIEDPFPKVAGKGIAQLRKAGLDVVVGSGHDEGLTKSAEDILSPYIKLLRTGRPWVIAKWAMTLDGKIATSTGDSQWISSASSRAIVHQLRGRVDAVIVGSRTALADNPTLTARPTGPRQAARIVFDSTASLATLLPGCELAKTIDAGPVLIAASSSAAEQRVEQLEKVGIEVLRLDGASHTDRLDQLLLELGNRRMTNVLVEGGGGLLGALMDAKQIDEVHAFIAAKIIGGENTPSPIAGVGRTNMANALQLQDVRFEQVEQDIYLHGRTE